MSYKSAGSEASSQTVSDILGILPQVQHCVNNDPWTLESVKDPIGKAADHQSSDGLVVPSGHFGELAECRKAAVDGQ